MVAKYKDKPFALIGIDSDGGQAALRKLMKDNGVTWRMIADGGTDGPIATKWNVQGWPTIYIIDQKGVIVHKSVGDDGTGERLDKIMADIK